MDLCLVAMLMMAAGMVILAIGSQSEIATLRVELAAISAVVGDRCTNPDGESRPLVDRIRTIVAIGDACAASDCGSMSPTPDQKET